MEEPKYANNGTYGCVFRPGVSCTKGKANDRNTVSKVFKKSSTSKEEVSLHNKIVDKIDPNGLFTVKLLESCTVNVNKFPETEIKKCKNFEITDRIKKKLPQIVYEYGGYDLKEAARRFPFEELFTGLIRIFGGITIMETKGYVHVDIKPENMVYNNETKKLSLIDFGMATKADNLYIRENDYIFQHPYTYYPPEFPLIANKMAGIKICEKYQNTEFLMSYVKLGLMNYPHKYSKCTDFLNELRELKKLEAKDVEGKLYVPMKIDVYMLGASILELLHLCEKHGTADINKNPEFYADVLRLCRGMIETSPSTRLSSKEAYDQYMLVVKKIRVIPASPKRPSAVRVKKSQPGPQKVCPPGKILNPVTNRCIKIKVDKICPPGKVLNPVTKRCNKVKVDKVKVDKVCPPGKVLNPLTNRCNKIKIKEKICPPGKVLNPITNRCNKIKQ